MAKIRTAQEAGIGTPKAEVSGIAPQNTPFQSIQSNAAAFGGGQTAPNARALSGTAAALNVINHQMQRERERVSKAHDLRNTLEIENKVRDYTAQWMETAKSRAGGGAAGISQEFADDRGKALSKILKGYTFMDEANKIRVHGFLQKNMDSLQSSLSGYEHKEMTAYNDGLLVKRKQGFIDAGANNWNNPDAFMKDEDEIENTIWTRYEAQGYSRGSAEHREFVQPEIDAAIGDHAAAAISGALASNTPEGTARAIGILTAGIQDNTVTGMQRVKLLKQVSTQTAITAGQSIGDTAVEKFPDDPTAAKQWIVDNYEGNLEKMGLERVSVLNDIAGETSMKQLEAKRSRLSSLKIDAEFGKLQLPEQIKESFDDVYVPGDPTESKKNARKLADGNIELQDALYSKIEDEEKARTETRDALRKEQDRDYKEMMQSVNKQKVIKEKSREHVKANLRTIAKTFVDSSRGQLAAALDGVQDTYKGDSESLKLVDAEVRKQFKDIQAEVTREEAEQDRVWKLMNRQYIERERAAKAARERTPERVRPIVEEARNKYPSDPTKQGEHLKFNLSGDDLEAAVDMMESFQKLDDATANRVRMEEGFARQKEARAAGGKGYDAATKVFAGARTREDAYKALEARRSELGVMAYEKALSVMDHKFAVMKAQQEDEIKSRFQSALANAQQGVEPKGILTIDFSQSQMKYINDTLEDFRRKQIDPEYDRIGDGVTWGVFMDNAGEPDKFAQLTLEELQAKYQYGVSEKTWNDKILPYWRSTRIAAGKEGGNAGAHGLSQVQALKNAMIKAGLNPKDEREYASFGDEFQRRVQTDNAVSHKAKQEILNQMVLQEALTVKDGFFSDTTRFPRDMTHEDKTEYAATLGIARGEHDTFANYFTAIIDGLRKSGKQITDATIKTVWQNIRGTAR